MQNHLSFIIFTFFTFSAVRPDFYMLGNRYYNSDECYSTSYLDHFTFAKSPMKNLDNLTRMKMVVKKTQSQIDVGAYFTSSNKSGLADSHKFFQNLRFAKLEKQKRKFFPQKMDCFKATNYWVLGFGFFDSYGIAYQLNPTIDEYVVSSARGNKAMDFVDLFTIFLDIFRALELVYEQGYYVGDFGEDDVGINLFTEDDGTLSVQGRIRKLHDFKIGNKDKKCEAAKMGNYNKNKDLYLANTGKRQMIKNNIFLCQALNIGGALDVFETYASKAIFHYHQDKDRDFSRCFNEEYNMLSRCPESLKPIWSDKTNRYLYRSIRKMLVKWTPESMIEHLIRLFQLLKDKEILRLSLLEKKRLEEIKQQEIDKLKKEKEKELRRVLAEELVKLNDKNRREKQSEDQSVEIESTPVHDIVKIRSNETHTPHSNLSNSQSQHFEISIQKKKTVRSETTEDFIQNFNVEHSHNSSELTDTIEDEKEVLKQGIQDEQNKIREQLNEFIQHQFDEKNNKFDNDDDEEIIGNVKNPTTKVIETSEQALELEEQRVIIMNKFKENLENEINVIIDEEAKRKEIKRIDSIEQIMEMKNDIDLLKDNATTFELKQELDLKITDINHKIDEAISKYGVDREVVKSNQVVITLGSLKRELDPYYLKSKIKNFGTLEIQNAQNDFIFL